MKIRTAESEGTDASVALAYAIVLEPWLGLRVDIHRRSIDAHRRIRRADIDRGRQHAMVQRQRRFDRTRCTSGCFGMSDLRLYTADRDMPYTALIIRHDLAQRADFGGITDYSASAMRFDHANAGGGDSSIFVSAIETFDLAFSSRCVNALKPPIAGTAQPSDHGIDAITVAFGITQSF